MNVENTNNIALCPSLKKEKKKLEGIVYHVLTLVQKSHSKECKETHYSCDIRICENG